VVQEYNAARQHADRTRSEKQHDRYTEQHPQNRNPEVTRSPRSFVLDGDRHPDPRDARYAKESQSS
jgi:hypothetical protein